MTVDFLGINRVAVSAGYVTLPPVWPSSLNLKLPCLSDSRKAARLRNVSLSLI